MPNAELLISFFVATVIFAYVPGPAMLYATAQTIGGGKRAGWMAALGIHIGGYVHVIAAAFGLAILFMTVPTVYLALKFVGAAYLIWLGISLFRTGLPKSASDEFTPQKSPLKAFVESAMVEIFNPKTALFFLAFLPQFTDVSASLPIWAQLVVLGTIVNIMFSSADVVCVLLSSQVVKVLNRSKMANKWAQRIGGGMLVGLGVNLATGHN